MESVMDKKKIVVIGPVYPYKGGISHYTGLLVRALSKYNDVVCVSYKMQYPKLLMKKEQRDYSDKTFEIKDTKYLINTANPFNIIKSASEIRKMKPDAVIVSWWHPYFAPCYMILLSHLKNIRKGFICHNVFPHERFPLDRWLTKNTLKKGDFAIVHSAMDEDDLRTILPGMDICRHVHPSYDVFKVRDISRTDARQELGTSEDAKILLFFGFVRKYKGLDVLIRAMKDIDKEIILYVVGEFGDDREEYITMMKENGVYDRIIIKDGYIPNSEVEPYFAAADLCVCPYHSATQSGIVQISFGLGLPVLVTSVGGLPDVVDDGRTGFVVPPDDPNAVAETVNRYFNENLREEIRAGVKKEQERFSWDKMAEAINGMLK
ncbi:MAG: glycosyltransferase [Lachnospiraceae bacterium]|nr:glycosyltransferase [Lachnospiraceae bacterium]